MWRPPSPPWLASAACGALLSAMLVTALVLRARGRTPAATTARLTELQSRIRPHFLFNTLNSAIALVRAEPAKAESLLEDLSDLFRHALVEQGESVTLAEEITLAQRYLAIEEVRFGHRLQVQWSLDPRTDAARLPPLLLQPLVENAVKHGVEPSPRGGKLRMMTELRGSRVVVRITNTLPPSHIKNDAPRGHGIALANVRARLALLHDVQGEFTAGVQDGLYQVRITLPVEAPMRRPQAQRPQGAPQTIDHATHSLTFHTAESAMNILIVDDEPLARQRLRTLLSDCTDCQRTTVAEAGNAGEALALLGPTGGRGFDVLLLDIHMPGQDGLSLAHAVQALPQPPAVVFVTAYADHAVSAFELDAVDYLTKPVRRERLQQALAKVQRLQRPSTPAPISTLPEGETLLIQDRGRTERIAAARGAVFQGRAEVRDRAHRHPQLHHGWCIERPGVALWRALPAHPPQRPGGAPRAARAGKAPRPRRGRGLGRALAGLYRSAVGLAQASGCGARRTGALTTPVRSSGTPPARGIIARHVQSSNPLPPAPLGAGVVRRLHRGVGGIAAHPPTVHRSDLLGRRGHQVDGADRRRRGRDGLYPHGLPLVRPRYRRASGPCGLGTSSPPPAGPCRAARAGGPHCGRHGCSAACARPTALTLTRSSSARTRCLHGLGLAVPVRIRGRVRPRQRLA